MGRLVSDTVKVTYLAKSRVWSESRIYIAIVWLLIAAGVAILLSGLTEPLVLLIIPASLGGIIMFVYSGLLLVLNRRALPRAIEL